MKFTFALAAGAAWVTLLVAGSAHAGDHGGHPMFRPHLGLPPVSGTIRLSRNAFGGGHVDHGGTRWSQGRGRALESAPTGYRRGYGAALGYRDDADPLAEEDGAFRHGGDDPRRQSARRRPWWQGDGTGLVGLAGDEGYPDQGSHVGWEEGPTTGWGTADSATTGGTYPLPSPRYHAYPRYQASLHVRPSPQYRSSPRYRAAPYYVAEAPLEITYGEPDLWSGQGRRHGVQPTGGLAYYNSGSPSRMAYYSSGSSAGPYGSPGGLGIYSSGSFGPGPKIIHVSRHRSHGRFHSQGLFSGPHIIHVGHRSRYAGW